LPLEDSNDLDFDFEKGRSILAQGAELYVETPEGKVMTQKKNCSAVASTYYYVALRRTMNY